jgi:indolepyruvate ferredoxin oxidoreductase
MLTRVQALVRLMFDQTQADHRARLRAWNFVPGYPGSPLGGLHIEIARRSELRKAQRVEHVPAIIEEPVATAVWGAAPGPPQQRVGGQCSCECGPKDSGGPESFDPSPPLMRVR